MMGVATWASLPTWNNFNHGMDKYIYIYIYIHYEVWDEIATVEVWELTCNFTLHFTGHMITYPAYP